MWNDDSIYSVHAGTDNEDGKLPEHLEIFGFGRRVCHPAPGAVHHFGVSLLGYGYVFDTKSRTCTHSSAF